tara:strand:- start:3213 stop:4073 length:861 start_codon:yes stop_codon:yes gene_type:complete
MRFKIYLVLVVALLSISSTSLIVRYVSSVPALTLAFWRMLLSGILLLLFSWTYAKTNKNKRPKYNDIFIAGFFLGMHFSLFFLGIRETSVTNATLLACTGPIFTSLYSILKKEKLLRGLYLGLFYALFGICIIQVPNPNIENSSLYGDILCLLSGACIAVTFVYASKVRQLTDSITYSKVAFIVAALTIGLVCFLFGTNPLVFNEEHIIWFFALAIFPSILGHNLLTYSLKHLSPTAVASVPLGEPIIASILAFFIFSESIPRASFVGGPLILFGIYKILKSSLLR